MDAVKKENLINDLADDLCGCYANGGYEATAEEKKSKIYKAGYNAHVLERYDQRIKIGNWLSSFTETEQEMIYKLHEDEQLHVSFEPYSLCLNANDLFVWGCADSEDIAKEDLAELVVIAGQKHGISKWICKRRGEKPQKPIQEMMKKSGVWDDEMEALEDNYYWKNLEEKNKK